MTTKATIENRDQVSISDAELTVLDELWREGPTSPSRMHSSLVERGVSWAFTTVQTFLHRLRDKGYVRRRRQGRTWIYEPSAGRDEVFKQQVDDLARRVGSVPSSALLIGLVGEGKLSSAEIERLRSALDAAYGRADTSDGTPGETVPTP